jgi:hypothetical protein
VLGAVLNKAFEPTRSAVYARDFAQVRWLSMLSIVGRLLGQHFREPEVKVITRFLWKLVERPEGSWWDSCGVAFRLSRHPISEGESSLENRGRMKRFSARSRMERRADPQLW